MQPKALAAMAVTALLAVMTALNPAAAQLNFVAELSTSPYTAFESSCIGENTNQQASSRSSAHLAPQGLAPSHCLRGVSKP